MVDRAKRFSRRRGISISSLVEGFLDQVAAGEGHGRAAVPPVLARLRGALKQADLEAYREHLAAKYR